MKIFGISNGGSAQRRRNSITWLIAETEEQAVLGGYLVVDTGNVLIPILGRGGGPQQV
jgi:hypothetical protein